MTANAEWNGTEASALSAEIESLSYSISHDLRAPVRAVIGFSRALEEDYAALLDPEGQRLLAIISHEANRINGLIDGLLTFSRIGRQRMEAEAVDMTRLAREVALEQAESAGSAAAIFEIAELPGAVGDRALLRAVWSQLLSNAVKFSNPETGPCIEIGATKEPGRTVYHVRDHGIGFDMLYAEKLFGIFQKLHGGDAYPGLGVGLAIVKRIVQRHRGAVWADARPGEGATFFFGLPIGSD